MGMITTENIKSLYKEESLRWTNHAFERMSERVIDRQDVKNVLFKGEIIEQYPDDYPFPSCLLSGKSMKNRPLHVVCAVGSKRMYIVTAYYADESKWEVDMKIRR
jgi:hypothetical protein